jgi:hypothetical protein
VAACEQLVEHQAERVDIGGGGDRRTLHLLGRGVLQRQRAAPFLGQRAGRVGPRVALEQLGDAEVEQLDAAVARDEHVARLDVAMHDEVAVRMRDGGQHLHEQADALLDAQALRVGMAVDALAVDQLEHEVGLAVGRDAGIEHAGDVRVGQPRENRALAPEALCRRVAEPRQVQQLDRHAAFVLAVGAACPPDGAAAALADRRFEAVGADAVAGERHAGCGRHAGVAGQQGVGHRRATRGEQRLELARERRVTGMQGCQARRLSRGRQVQQLVEHGAELGPAVGIGQAHGERSGAGPSTVRQSDLQQHPCLFPLPLHGPLRDVFQRGDLGHRETAKELQVHDMSELGFERCELVEQLADARQQLGLAALLGGFGVERSDRHRPAALLRRALAHPVDHQAAHRACGVGQKARLVRERECVAAPHVEVGLMQQRRGAEGGLRAVALHLAPRQAVQVGVQQGEELVVRGRVARLGALGDGCDGGQVRLHAGDSAAWLAACLRKSVAGADEQTPARGGRFAVD